MARKLRVEYPDAFYHVMNRRPARSHVSVVVSGDGGDGEINGRGTANGRAGLR